MPPSSWESHSYSRIISGLFPRRVLIEVPMVIYRSLCDAGASPLERASITPVIALSSASVLSWCVSQTAKGVHSINPVLQARVSVCDISRFQEQKLVILGAFRQALHVASPMLISLPDLMLIPLLPSHPGGQIACRGSLADRVLLGL